MFGTNLARQLIALCVGKGSNLWNARRVFLSYTVFLDRRQEVRQLSARGQPRQLSFAIGGHELPTLYCDAVAGSRLHHAKDEIIQN